MHRLGLDIGSTTLKLVVVDDKGEICFTTYHRHFAGIDQTLIRALEEARETLGDGRISLLLTGSAGMGTAERLHLPFLQEVVAASVVVKEKYRDLNALIDIGGEDAKLIIFEEGKSPVIRMNGSCAGGTGSFIDQMANLLAVEVSELDNLAFQAGKTYPISSRCGVFAKTDIQNLLSRNIDRSDIAASIFHALVTQVITTLARGYEMKSGILLCGGPCSFIKYMPKAFQKVLKLSEEDFIIPEQAPVFSAYGCALDKDSPRFETTISEFVELLSGTKDIETKPASTLPHLFNDPGDYQHWLEKKQKKFIEKLSFDELEDEACFLGIDSGSTTTKIALTDSEGRLLFDFYTNNKGNPLQAVEQGLRKCHEAAQKYGKNIRIEKSCVTGYGEDLIKKAFDLDYGIVETIAHYLGAIKYNPRVSFILDIGGQDMKAIFIDKGIISRLEVNEACSSGCGSFIENFANSMNYPVSDFAREACEATHPCDLGTRCTVFMNSKVKQFLRTNTPISDIAAGLSYSVVKNLLHKVLKIKNTSELGDHISAQGGTFKNHSVVRALEKATGKEVSFTDKPELMGALGCVFYAMREAKKDKSGGIPLNTLTAPVQYQTKQSACKGCENQCQILVFNFGSGNKYFAGNKCEKVFSNRGENIKPGQNLSEFKNRQIFDRTSNPKDSPTIGIPRVLNTYENYPFWHTLLTASGLNVVLSDPSTFTLYESGVSSVMADNICFPAKLAHGHIHNLVEKKVDRIFIPYVVYEQKDDAQSTNSFNCPVVSGYSDVIKSAMTPGIPVDSPTITFRDRKLLYKACYNYIRFVSGNEVSRRKFTKAFNSAIESQESHRLILKQKSIDTYKKAMKENKMLILLAGRPYHHDPLIQHKVSDMIAGFGIDVITDDIVQGEDILMKEEVSTVMQWSYINRIIKAAQWASHQPSNVQFVELTSFGCGPDAFITDEVADILRRNGKTPTFLKVDDVSNIGSLRLRIRSTIESMKLAKEDELLSRKAAVRNAVFEEKDKGRTIIVPHFSEIYSPFIPVIGRMAGYRIENLPPSTKGTIDCGLKYSNNEVCYPATIVIGDVIHALQSGKYDLDTTAVGITQTGGQCRATNYMSLMKKAMIEAGFKDIPVISVNTSKELDNHQPGFTVDWLKIIKPLINVLLFSDVIAKLYYASVVREKEIGAAQKVRDFYITRMAETIETSTTKDVYQQLTEAVAAFNSIIDPDKKVVRVGIVGEIYVKYNHCGNYDTINWLIEQGAEVVVPPLTNFAIQGFVNSKVDRKHLTNNITRAKLALNRILFGLLQNRIKKFNKIGSTHPFYLPLKNIFHEAGNASQLVNLSAQFGEGWLIPAEFAFFSENNINQVVSLQPFGCIANHIISKGIEKKVMQRYPRLNLLFLDFDSSVSEVNVQNRLHFMINNARADLRKAQSSILAEVYH